MFFSWQSCPMFAQLALIYDPQYIYESIFLENFLPWTILSILGFQGKILSNISNSSLDTTYGLDPRSLRIFIPSLSFPLVSSLSSSPLIWFLNFVFYIVLSRIFLALLIVQPQLLGYWTWPLPPHMYPLYWSGRYQQRLHTGPCINRDRQDDCLWGGGGVGHPTLH